MSTTPPSRPEPPTSPTILSLTDWDRAPDWARFIAMDANGNWYWHECPPRAVSNFWTSEGRVQAASRPLSMWKSTMQVRPK